MSVSPLKTLVRDIFSPALYKSDQEVYGNKLLFNLIGLEWRELSSVEEFFEISLQDQWEVFYKEMYQPSVLNQFANPLHLPFVHRDGTTAHVVLNGYSTAEEEIWIITDVTAERESVSEGESKIKNLSTALLEIKRLKTKASEENFKLKKTNRELEEFAYVASHDLKEPLRKILAFSKRLNEKYADLIEERGQFYLERISNASVRMQTLIDDLLRYSKVSRNEVDFDMVDMVEVLDMVEDRVERLLYESNGNLIIENAIPVRGNKTLLTSLFQNLIHNGIKFAKPGLAPVVVVDSKVIIKKGEDYAEYRVSDNGIGVDAQFQKRIFQIFERLHGKESYEGTGIGLAICKRIVEKHGGTIKLESESEEGSTFIINLPIA